MSGHNKWSKIKHTKAITDARKGKVFSKIAKTIVVAARKGGDPGMNSTLRLAIDKAKAVNMPNDNIERAIKKGTGKGKEKQLEEITYEAYGPNGIPLMIETITDNKNRTLSEIRHILSRNNGRLGETGSVKWMFNQKGSIEVILAEKSKDELELAAIDAGAEDIEWKNNVLEIYTEPNDLEKVKENLEKARIKIEDASLDWIPKNEVEIKDESLKNQLERLFEALDENEDVNEIFSNVNPNTLS